MLYDRLQAVGVPLVRLGLASRELERRDEPPRRREGHAGDDRSLAHPSFHLDDAACVGTPGAPNSVDVDELGQQAPGLQTGRMVVVPGDDDGMRTGASHALEEAE